MLEQVVEVIGLHGHVVKLQERKALFHPLLEALCPEHVVDREASANVPDKLYIVEVQKPVGVVHHLGLAGAKLNEPLHLLFEALAVVLNGLLGHHGAHVRPTGGVANHGGTAANEGNGLISRHLQPLHETQGHKMAHMEGICRGVKANVEGSLAVVHHFPDFCFVGHLSNEATGHQFVIYFHTEVSFSIQLPSAAIFDCEI